MKLELIYTTFPEIQAAKKACQILLEEQLIACANIIPHMASLYRWQGKIQSADELVVILKTTETIVPELMARLKELHPYDVPCILCLGVKNADDEYTKWVSDALGGSF